MIPPKRRGRAQVTMRSLAALGRSQSLWVLLSAGVLSAAFCSQDTSQELPFRQADVGFAVDTSVTAVGELVVDSITAFRRLAANMQLAFVTSMVARTEAIVVTDLGYFPHAALIDPASGSIERRFPVEGHPARVFADPRVAGFDPHDSTLVWLWDTRTNSMAPVSLGGQEDGKVVALPRMSEQLYAPVTAKDYLLFPGYFLAKTAVAIGYDGEGVLELTGAPPFPMKDTLAAEVDKRGILNKGQIAVDPTGHRIAIAYRHVAQLHIIDLSRRKVRVVRGPSPAPTVYEVINGVPKFGPDHRLSYMDLTATASHLYALFSGRPARRDSPAPSTIHVYTWDGALEKVIELDLGVTAIAVVNDGATLYGATYEDGFAEVAVWQLGQGSV